METVEQLLAGLKAAAEPTRLRLLTLLAESELTVTELTQILRQSQPRVSRHLKLLCEASLLERFREGSWVFYRLADRGAGAQLANMLVELVPENDAVVLRDIERLEAVRAARAERASAYFSANAAEWDRIRALYLPEDRVEDVLLDLCGAKSIERYLDVGTGTGRLLEVFATRVQRGLGIDMSPEMLAVARANLEREGIANCHVRQGDLFDLPVEDGEMDLVTVNLVLHYLDDPAGALNEAARTLKPGGQLLVVDFAPHELDFLRDAHAHRRLGFAEQEIAGWLKQAGLQSVSAVSLPPEPGSDAQLTVLVWRGERPATDTARRTSAAPQERLQAVSS